MSKSFEDLDVWKKSFDLSKNIYIYFKDLKDFGFKDQITRSSLSIVSNIAEGYERNNDKEFRRYLVIAKGSAGELRAQLMLATEIGYINGSNNYISETKEVSKMLQSLITYLSKCIKT